MQQKEEQPKKKAERRANAEPNGQPKGDAPNKVIVTNASVFQNNYGEDGINLIKAALDTLIAADAARGLQTIIVWIDDPRQMKQLKSPAVIDKNNKEQNKRAIDAVFNFYTPEYLVLLGSTAVIPHQTVKNPVYNPGYDEDRTVDTDIPYACAAPCSDDPTQYVAPTRVVGRIPDLPGSSEPSYLTGLLETCSQWKQGSPSAYQEYLGISARVWQQSTGLSLRSVFGSPTDLQISPKEGPKWTQNLLSRMSHFINCHGASADSHYYGQEGEEYPVAHDAAFLSDSTYLPEGTVVAAECCYGAELFDPELNDGIMGICHTYLGRKCYGFFGSSTIAYGPADSNSDADLICQYFLKCVLAGASTGRAALEARQQFVQSSGSLDPIGIKTLMQFNLMGDPSIQPVPASSSEASVSSKGFSKGLEIHKLEGRKQRRLNLFAIADALSKVVPVTDPTPTKGIVADTLMGPLITAENLSQSSAILSFDVKNPSRSLPRGAKGLLSRTSQPERVHVLFSREPDKEAPKAFAKGIQESKQPGIRSVTALVAWEQEGRIVSYRKIFRR